jgi:hypothetical protein
MADIETRLNCKYDGMYYKHNNADIMFKFRDEHHNNFIDIFNQYAHILENINYDYTKVHFWVSEFSLDVILWNKYPLHAMGGRHDIPLTEMSNLIFSVEIMIQINNTFYGCHINFYLPDDITMSVMDDDTHIYIQIYLKMPDVKNNKDCLSNIRACKFYNFTNAHSIIHEIFQFIISLGDDKKVKCTRVPFDEAYNRFYGNDIKIALKD